MEKLLEILARGTHGETVLTYDITLGCLGNHLIQANFEIDEPYPLKELLIIHKNMIDYIREKSTPEDKTSPCAHIGKIIQDILFHLKRFTRNMVFRH